MVQKLETPAKHVVGLTGGFGSGKTTVAHLFEELGATVIDADHLAHEALLEGSPVYERIREEFKEAEGAEGLDRKKIACVIFKDAGKRKKLESIVHPYVLSRILEEIGEAGDPVVIVEVPLLYETGFDALCHKVIFVDAPQEAIDRRLKEKGFSEEEIAARRKAQMSPEEKLKKADCVIRNFGTLQQTRRDVEKMWKELHPASKGDPSRQCHEKK